MAYAQAEPPLIGLKLENVKGLKPSHAAFQRIYDRAMQDLPLPIRPSLTVVHCNTEDLNMFSTRITVGQRQDDIYLAQADEWQFANAVSLEVFMRMHNRNIRDLAEKAHKAGQRKQK